MEYLADILVLCWLSDRYVQNTIFKESECLIEGIVRFSEAKRRTQTQLDSKCPKLSVLSGKASSVSRAKIPDVYVPRDSSGICVCILSEAPGGPSARAYDTESTDVDRRRVN